MLPNPPSLSLQAIEQRFFDDLPLVERTFSFLINILEKGGDFVHDQEWAMWLLNDLGIRTSRSWSPEPNMGFWLREPESDAYVIIRPRIIAYDFYGSEIDQLEEIMSVNEWHRRMEELDRTGQLDSPPFPPRFIFFNFWPIEGGLRESGVEEPITVQEWERQVGAMEQAAQRSMVEAKQGG